MTWVSHRAIKTLYEVWCLYFPWSLVGGEEERTWVPVLEVQGPSWRNIQTSWPRKDSNQGPLSFFPHSFIGLSISCLLTRRFLDMRDMDQRLAAIPWNPAIHREHQVKSIDKVAGGAEGRGSLHHRQCKFMSLPASGRVMSQIPAAWCSAIHCIDISAT